MEVFSGDRWIPQKASDAELWSFFFICALTSGWANNRDAGDLRRCRAHYDVTIMECIRQRSMKHSKFWSSSEFDRIAVSGTGARFRWWFGVGWSTSHNMKQWESGSLTHIIYASTGSMYCYSALLGFSELICSDPLTTNDTRSHGHRWF